MCETMDIISRICCNRVKFIFYVYVVGLLVHQAVWISMGYVMGYLTWSAICRDVKKGSHYSYFLHTTEF
jgi:hypothetical protein